MPVDSDELRQEFNDIQEELKIVGDEKNMHRDQVNKVLVLAGSGGNTVNRGNKGKKEYKNSEILLFSGLDQRALWEWMEYFAMKIADKPRKFAIQQKKMIYMANQLEGLALN